MTPPAPGGTNPRAYRLVIIVALGVASCAGLIFVLLAR